MRLGTPAVLVGLAGLTGVAHADTLVRFTFTLNYVAPPSNPVYTNVYIYADIFASPASTSANLLNYVNSCAYNNSVINRSVPGVLQGGAFKFNSPPNNNSFSLVPANTSVPIQYTLPNALGTIAMVPTGNAVTSSFLFNTADNSSAFAPGGTTAGGYPVVGKVLNHASLANLSSLAAIPTINDSGNVDPSIASSVINLPLTQSYPFYPFFVNITSVTTLAKMGDINGDGIINIDDFLRLDSAALRPPAGLLANNFAADWAKGDLNLDGTVDASDFALMNTAYQQSAGGLATGELQANLPANVPEPATLALLVVGGMTLLRRRRV